MTTTANTTKTQIDESYAIELGRSLHVGVIGLGQCGGNIAAAFAAKRYPAFVVNTSKTDLASLEGLSNDDKIAVGGDGFYGAGGSLSLGGDALRGGAEQIEERALHLFDDVELVIAIGGLGGGTGGNLAELVNMLSGQEFPVVALAVLPSASEGHRVKTNALWGLNELVDSDLEALILVDNNKLFATHGDEGVSSFMDKCNSVVVDAIDRLNTLSSAEGMTSIRTFDPNDLRQVVRFGGVTVFGSREVEGAISRDSLLQAFIEVLNSNEVLATGFEHEDAVVVGSIITAPANVLSRTPAAAFDDYFREVRMVTSGAMHRSGIYVGGNEPARLYVVASGLPLPTRCRDLLSEATAESNQFGQKKQSARAKLTKLDLSALGVGEVEAGSQRGTPTPPEPCVDEAPTPPATAVAIPLAVPAADPDSFEVDGDAD